MEFVGTGDIDASPKGGSKREFCKSISAAMIGNVGAVFKTFVFQLEDVEVEFVAAKMSNIRRDPIHSTQADTLLSDKISRDAVLSDTETICAIFATAKSNIK